MRIEGSQTYPAEPDVIWSLVSQPETIVRILSGCDVFESVGSNQHRFVLSLRIGKVVELMAFTLDVSQVIPFKALSFRADGQSLSGTLKIQGQISLEKQAPDCTELTYAAEIDGDQFKAVSPRMLQTMARAFARRTLEALDKEVAIRTRVYTTTTFRSPQTVTVSPAQRHRALGRAMAIIFLFLVGILIRRGLDRLRAREAALLIEPDGQPLDGAFHPTPPPERSVT
jgi:carbon monoxide dehydrogenase subunit G